MSALDEATSLDGVVSGSQYSHPLWRRVLISRETAMIGILVVVTVLALAMLPNFAQRNTVYYLLTDVMAALLIALPMAMIMIAGDIDISVGSIVGLSCSLLGLLYSKGVPFELAMPVVIVVASACGFLNGWLITRFGLPSLAVTIGTLALYRGVAVGLLGTTAITTFPENWQGLVKAQILESGVPLVVIPFLALLAVFTVVLHFTPFGRGVYSIGLSAEAASFAGVRVAGIRRRLFMASGAISGLAGIYWTLHYGTARGDVANGLELQVIAAVVLGGVSVFGGRGAIHGVIAGVLLIGVLSSASRMMGVTADVIKIITGFLLIATVVMGSVGRWFQARVAKSRTHAKIPR
jgi:rhamnose transport system permease protein